MATEVDTILGRTSRFFNKRMREVSSLIAFFRYQVYSLQFWLHYNNNLSFFQGLFLDFIDLELGLVYKYKKKKRNLADLAMDLLLVELLKIFYMNQRMEGSSRNF